MSFDKFQHEGYNYRAIGVDQEIVRTSEGKFNEHPDAYSPRIFFTVGWSHYELLRTGAALIWPSLPTTFEFMHFNLEGLSSFNKRRPAPPLNELLDAARKYTMTPEEREAQRQSWVRGEMAIGTDADEARYQGLHLESCCQEFVPPVPPDVWTMLQESEKQAEDASGGGAVTQADGFADSCAGEGCTPCHPCSYHLRVGEKSRFDHLPEGSH